MDKILVNISIPAMEEKYDILVSPEMKIEQLIGIIISSIIEMSEGKYISSEKEMLCKCDIFGVLDPSFALNDYEIGDGAFLMLV